MKKITIEMACSINGLIATEDGGEDFLSYRGWEIMIELLKEYDVLIWGRKTWDNILSWGEEYLKDLKDINIIILSSKNTQRKEFPNVIYCNSIAHCLEVCEDRKFEKLFISGGAKVNNEFMEKGIVDSIILNYNPFVLITILEIPIGPVICSIFMFPVKIIFIFSPIDQVKSIVSQKA
jgi:dihydrofolate reductase